MNCSELSGDLGYYRLPLSECPQGWERFPTFVSKRLAECVGDLSLVEQVASTCLPLPGGEQSSALGLCRES